MPRWAAPNATKVATSNERTRMMSRSGWLVVKRSRRESGSANAGSGSMPAPASTGAASFRIRPLGRARISFSFASRCTVLLGRMGGLPRGGPRLPDIPQMACEPVDFQPYGAVGGEPQQHQAGLLLDRRQQFQHPVGLLEGDLVMVDGLHRIENQGGMGSPVLGLDGRIGFPAEAVEQENKTALGRKEGAVAHRDQRILHGSGNDAEIVGIERRKLELAVHRRGRAFRWGRATPVARSSLMQAKTRHWSGAPPAEDIGIILSAVRYRRHTPRASPRAARSRGRDGRRGARSSRLPRRGLRSRATPRRAGRSP